MSEREQIQHFADELDKLVDRYREEYELSFASVVGTLSFKAFNLMQEAQREGEDER